MHKINNQKDTLEAKVNKNKLAKNKKDGKWLFFMSLCAWLLCTLLSSKFNSELLSYTAFFFFIVQIGSIFLWGQNPKYRQGFSSRNSLDYITDPTYNYHAGNIYNHRR